MEHPSRFYRNSFVIATVVLLGWLMCKLLAPLWDALAWAVVLSFLLFPAHVRLTRALKHRASLSAGLITALTPFVIVAPLSMLAVIFARQVSVLIGYLKDHSLLSLAGWLDRLDQIPLLGRLVRWAQDNTPVTTQQVEDWAGNAAHGVLEGAASLSGQLVVGVAGTVVTFVLALFLLFFLLRDGRLMVRTLVRLIPMEREPLDKLVHDLATVLRAVVFGSVMTAVLQGVFVGIAWAIVGLPSPVVFGALTAAAAFIPAVGSAVVLVPAILYLAVLGHWGSVIFLLVWTGLLALGEQLVRPFLTSRQAEVPALAVFIGAIGGVAAFGFIGFILGPVLINLVITLIRLAGEWVRKEA